MTPALLGWLEWIAALAPVLGAARSSQRRKTAHSAPATPLLSGGETYGPRRNWPSASPARTREPEVLQAPLSLLDQLHNAVMAADLEGRVTFWNRHAEAVFHWRRDEVLGKPLGDLVFPPSSDDRMAPITESLLENGHWQGEVSFCRKDGTQFPAVVTGAVLRGPSGESVGVVGVATDVSESKRDAEALRKSEAALRALLECGGRGVVLIERGGTVGAFNRQACDFARRIGAPEPVVGDTFDWQTCGAAPAIADQIASAFAGRPARAECQLQLIDGARRWYEIEALPVRAQDGEIIGVCLWSAEIDQRKRAEQANNDAAEIAAALARVGRELIASLSSPDLLRRLCAVTAEVLGCEMSHTLMRLSDEDVFVPIASDQGSRERLDTLAQLRFPRALFDDVLAPLERDDVLIVGAVPAGLAPQVPDLARYESICLALRRGRDLIGLQTAQRLRSERPFSETQIRIARGIAQIASLALNHARVIEELEHANRVKSDFVATMSHELRTPLHVILGYADLLRSGEFGDLSEPQAATVDRLLRRARELHELIDCTLEVSRMDSGRAVVHVEEVALGALIAEVAAECQPPSGPAAAFFVRIAPDLPPLLSDPAKLKVVLKTLIGNAFKFTERGSVSVDVRPHRDGVEIEVRDTGVGIAADVLPHLFQPFHQGDPSPSRRYGGVGLGLYVARRMIELLSGSIRAQSSLGKGTAFTVLIPIMPLSADEPLHAPAEADAGA